MRKAYLKKLGSEPAFVSLREYDDWVHPVILHKVTAVYFSNMLTPDTLLNAINEVRSTKIVLTMLCGRSCVFWLNAP